jgi:hypothetical protein
MKLRDLNYFTQKEYVYSTSYRFCFPFTFTPATTIAPTNGDFSKAVSILWNRKDRHLLPELHQEMQWALAAFGLDQLYRFALLAFVWPAGSREALELLAEGSKQSGDEFPFSELTRRCVRSFAPSKIPNRNQLEEARAIWSRGNTLGKPA